MMRGSKKNKVLKKKNIDVKIKTPGLGLLERNVWSYLRRKLVKTLGFKGLFMVKIINWEMG